MDYEGKKNAIKKKFQSLPVIDQRLFEPRQYASLTSDELMKMLPQRKVSLKQLENESKGVRKSIEFVGIEKAEEGEDCPKVDLSYVPYENNMTIHRHEHRGRPHMHTANCDRLISAYDLQRDKRYYFTDSITPVRVYIKYDKQLNKILSPVETGILETAKGCKQKQGHFDFTSDGQKMNLQALRFNLGISKKFLKEASSMVFMKETLSFIPSSAAAHLAVKKQETTLTETTQANTATKVPKSSISNSPDQLLNTDYRKSPDENGKKVKRKVKF